MISWLQGELIEVNPPTVILNVQGVGYELAASLFTCEKLPAVGQTAVLYTHFVVREDAQLLFGFIDKNERDLFRMLIKTSGVGPKLALTILSHMEPNTFVSAVEQNNNASIVKIPGIGKKTAERLLIEIRDRLKDWYPSKVTSQSIGTHDNYQSADTENAINDAISALVALGYKPNQVRAAVMKLPPELHYDSQALIRQALQILARGVATTSS
ncbi:MAG: Holliday junction branch migration protein RuvA [Gammaproteobacteria bacterium]